MNEKLLEIMANMGFITEEVEGFGHTFKYEGSTMLLMDNNGDEEFLNIAVPGIIDFDDVDELTFYHLADKVNSTLKYVKCYKFSDGLWLFYERELFGGEDLEKIIARMIMRLEAALIFFRKAKNEMENPPDDDDDDDDDDNDNALDGSPLEDDDDNDNALDGSPVEEDDNNEPGGSPAGNNENEPKE